MYPPYLIDKQIKLFLNNTLSENDTPKENSNKENTTYHKLLRNIYLSYAKAFSAKLTSILF